MLYYNLKEIVSITAKWATNENKHRTSLLGLRLEKTRRGHLRCRWPEHQLRMLSHSTVLDGPGPSSLCRRTSFFRARTAVFSSICSNWRGREERYVCNRTFIICLSFHYWNAHTSPRVGSWSPSPTIRMQSAWRMQRWVHGVMLLSVWYRTIRLMSSCWASQPERRYSWILMNTRTKYDGV